ncbi:hypothetical protein B566_EDAN007197 [Ephemera danica]|nr:hypothetical protein B566_EDAN007197 [Ephemera danica]
MLLRCVLEPSSPVADPACMAVCNMTREPGHAEQAWQQLQSEEGLVDRLVAALSGTKYNQRDAALHYLAPLISNLSQLTQVRRMLLDPERCVMQRLLPFTQYTESSIRRGGVISTLRNCCFDVEHHEWLLSPTVDLLPALLLPLAGPDVFSEEETEKLPPDLQYLEENKQRESDPDLRRLILEAIARLCARRSTRVTIREQEAAYLILRELHKWEEDRAALLACENLVDLLIRTEEEIGVDDLRDVDVPENLTTTFTKEDETFIQLS